MRFWVAVTDNRWFEYVQLRRFDEVNFWQPSARAPFTSLPAGTPFLFKLKRPHNCIAGGGRYVSYSQLPLSLAWDAFEGRNGAASLPDLRSLINSNSTGISGPNPDIGCTVVTEVFFLSPDRWIPLDRWFASNIVRGRTYDTTAIDGAELWKEVQAMRLAARVSEPVPLESERFGRAFLTHARLGQGSFRTLVIDAYSRRCAITGESTLPALEAAHIRPFADNGPHQVSNGLLLRSDFHKLFDAGLVTVEPDHTVQVSGRIRDQYFNGKAYYRLKGQKLIALPAESLDHPSAEYLRWHNNERFVA